MYIETIEDFSDAEGLVGIDWAVENLISEYNPTIIYGPGGSYKSLVALHLALCLQNGLPFHNKKTSKGNVLYISLEGIFDIAPRYAAYKQEHGEPAIIVIIIFFISFLPIWSIVNWNIQKLTLRGRNHETSNSSSSFGLSGKLCSPSF